MPRKLSSLFSSKSPSAPIGVSLTSIGGDGKDNPAFIMEPKANGSVTSDQSVPASRPLPYSNGSATQGNPGGTADHRLISVIADNNILTHRNAHNAANIGGAAGNGSALPIAPSGSPDGKVPSSQPSPEAVKTDGVEMKKSINLLHMIAILVSVTGHSSIFIAPSSILAQAGSIGGALVVWLLGGLIHLGQALCFAELGTMFPGAGGPYAYTMKAFGPLMAFLILWGYTVLIAGPFWAFLARTAAVYILRPAFPDCTSADVDTATSVLAGWIIVTFVLLNCVYMKYVTKVQTLLTSSKLIVLLIIIAAGIYYLAKGETDNFQDPFEDTAQEPGQFALAIFYATFAYGGWQVMTTMLAEVKDPSRSVGQLRMDND
ncbi:hypothetical protein PoB_004859600 [Plakobranchus ocellatus]|uniref:Amino acid permease/ SLC12A domain-containing protein n=1 Tax=Plakobranchus ocellatus TaxID=259542 RepID=A0AAV4BFI3_9GAST|nr:hypothetical protein PoB_004859600 [Plakobranchus ocellatus]